MPTEKTPEKRITAAENTKVREVTGLPFRLTLNSFTGDASNHRFQSVGGNAMRQKPGAGLRNSTPTSVGPLGFF